MARKARASHHPEYHVEVPIATTVFAPAASAKSTGAAAQAGLAAGHGRTDEPTTEGLRARHTRGMYSDRRPSRAALLLFLGAGPGPSLPHAGSWPNRAHGPLHTLGVLGRLDSRARWLGHRPGRAALARRGTGARRHPAGVPRRDRPRTRRADRPQGCEARRSRASPCASPGSWASGGRASTTAWLNRCGRARDAHQDRRRTGLVIALHQALGCRR